MKILWSGLKATFKPRFVVKELGLLPKGLQLFMGLAILVQVLAFATTGDFSGLGWLGLFTGIIAIINVILTDKGLLSNYFWGFFSTLAWLIVAIQSRLIGDFSSQLYYLIMQFVGIYFWFKAMKNSQTDYVRARKLTRLQIVGIVLLTLVIYGANVLIAQHFHGIQILLDATLLPLGIVGQILMTYAFASQWVFWIAIDAINVVIWVNNLMNPAMSAGASITMLILQIFMLANAFYGAYSWFKDAQLQKNQAVSSHRNAVSTDSSEILEFDE